MVSSEDEICLISYVHEKTNILPRYLHLDKFSWLTLKKDTGNSRVKLSLSLKYVSSLNQANHILKVPVFLNILTGSLDKVIEIEKATPYSLKFGQMNSTKSSN